MHRLCSSIHEEGKDLSRKNFYPAPDLEPKTFYVFIFRLP